MISKILFTIFVILGTLIFFRKKREFGIRQTDRQPADMSENEKMLRQGAWLFMIFMVISAIVFFIFEIGDRYATVNVHVINSETGKRVTYQAEQKNIKSNMFTTLEGRTVYVADTERVEIEP